MEIEITDALANMLLRKAEERGVAIDEYLLYLASVDLNVDERVELYLKLYEKYLREAEEYTEKGDIVQAGEKYWGAVTTLLCGIAEQRGWRHYHHRDYSDIIENLAEELKDPEIARLFAGAERLHANYYHNFLKSDTFRIHKADVEKLIEKVKKASASQPRCKG